MKRFGISALSAALALVTSSSAFAVSDPTDFSGLTDGMTESFVRTIAIGADHRAIMSASPLGAVIGLDVGVEVVAVKLPSDFKQHLQTVGAGSAPSLIPIPRLNLHKGLPYGINLGVSWISYDGNSAIGGDVQWTFLKSIATPALAIRAGYTSSKIFFMDTSSWKFDLLVSKKLPIIDPYLGVGIQFLSGELVESGAAQIPNGVKKSHSQSAAHVFAGLPIKLGLFKMSPEIDYSFVGIANYAFKFSLAF